MGTWRPAALDEVLSYLNGAERGLHPQYRLRFESMRVEPRQIPVARYPGEFIWVVAEYEGKVLYWSDIDEGWELEAPNSEGGIQDRGCNQYELKHILYQLFGSPELLQ